MGDTETAEVTATEGQAEVAAEAPATTEEGAPSLRESLRRAFSTQEVGSTEATEPTQEPATYTVKVDGEDVQVTLEEALAGYSRTADYTRKTQEIAAQRQELAQAEALRQALERDPQRTLEVLATAYGITPQAAAQAVAQATAESDPWDTDDEPAIPRELAERIERTERFIAQQEEDARIRAIDDEIAAIKQQYGEFDEAKLIAHAIQNEIPNLRAAYADMTYGEVYERARSVQEQAQAEADAEVTEAKRAAAVVHDTTSSSAKSTSAFSTSKPKLREVLEAAFRDI